MRVGGEPALGTTGNLEEHYAGGTTGDTVRILRQGREGA
jgi:hypothetical protein